MEFVVVCRLASDDVERARDELGREGAAELDCEVLRERPPGVLVAVGGRTVSEFSKIVRNFG